MPNGPRGAAFPGLAVPRAGALPTRLNESAILNRRYNNTLPRLRVPKRRGDESVLEDDEYGTYSSDGMMLLPNQFSSLVPSCRAGDPAGPGSSAARAGFCAHPGPAAERTAGDGLSAPREGLVASTRQSHVSRIRRGVLRVDPAVGRDRGGPGPPGAGAAAVELPRPAGTRGKRRAAHGLCGHGVGLPGGVPAAAVANWKRSAGRPCAPRPSACCAT